MGLVGSVVVQGPAGYRWHHRHWGLPEGVGMSGGIGAIREVSVGFQGVSGVHQGDHRECRYSGASMHIGGIRWLIGGIGDWELLGV